MVAGFATLVERRVPAASGGDVHAGVVARQAEVVLRVSLPGSAFTSRFLLFGAVGIVALQAIADRRAVDGALERCGVFVRMAGEAKSQAGWWWSASRA